MSNGGPAFPYGVKQTVRYPYEDERIVERNEEGMSLRDYFAAKAMAMMLHSEIRKDAWANVAAVAQDAYKMADAMLKQRDIQ